jgi:protein tyrosine/serine phosphatase
LKVNFSSASRQLQEKVVKMLFNRTKFNLFKVSLITLTLGLATASTEKAQAQYDLPGGFAQVEGQIYRGAHPSMQELATLKKMGFKTIMTLEHPSFLGEGDELEEEKRNIAQLGLRFIQASIFPIRHPSDSKTRRIVEIMADKRNWPIFVHCKLGDDRTGYVIGAYRVMFDRWKGRMAYEEMKHYGFKLFWWKGDFKDFSKRYGIGW